MGTEDGVNILIRGKNVPLAGIEYEFPCRLGCSVITVVTELN
jgi:hypothetical protein